MLRNVFIETFSTFLRFNEFSSFKSSRRKNSNFCCILYYCFDRFQFFQVIPVVFTKISSQINSENQKYDRVLAIFGIGIDIGND